jgi:O-antigen/teichoic acid export membrane protein
MRARILSGLAWKSISQVTLLAMRLIVGVVLARLLTPHEFGLAGMVIVFSGLGMLFADLGFAAALVQRRTLSEHDRSTAFWTTLAVGAVLTLAGVALSGPISDFYGEPAVRPMFAVLSLGFTVGALEATMAALLSRELQFRKLEIRRIIAAVAAAAVGIVAAVLGAGAWSIIYSQLAAGVIAAVLIWTLSPWHPKFQYSFESLRTLGGYSSKVFGWNFLFFLNRNSDNMLIGRYLGASALGLYTVAYSIMLLPLTQISTPVRNVLFPAFSRLQDDPERVASLWLRANRVIAALTLPAALGIIAIAPEFVSVALGERWLDAVPVIRILAWVGLLLSLQRLNGSVLQARNQAGTVLAFAVVAFLASLSAFVIGLQWGLVGVAASYAVATTLIQPLFTWLTARSVSLPLLTYARSFSGVAQAAVVMFACVFATKALLVEQGVPTAARLLICVLLGLAVFLPVCARRSPEVVAEVQGVWRGSSRARRRALTSLDVPAGDGTAS